MPKSENGGGYGDQLAGGWRNQRRNIGEKRGASESSSGEAMARKTAKKTKSGIISIMASKAKK
jgi:hypothetical protein